MSTPPEPAVVPADAVVVQSFTVHPVTLFGAGAGNGTPAVLGLLRGVANADGSPRELSLLFTPEGALDLADALESGVCAARPSLGGRS